MSLLSPEEEGRRVFVGGLAPCTTHHSLRAYFASYMPVVDAEVKTTYEGVSRGFGFVTFTTASGAQQCFNMQPHQLDGKTVELRMATKNLASANTFSGGKTSDIDVKATDPEAPIMRRLRVTKLSDGVTEAGLGEYFGRCGRVESVTVTEDMEGGPSVAVVAFASAASVET